MNKNRFILCLLLCGLMLYYAVPRLSVTGGGLEQIFSIAWLSFMLIAIAGNLTALLYSPKKAKRLQERASVKRKKKRVHVYQ